jgi:hypothetical protein
MVHRIEHMLGPTPLIRTGRPPKTLLVYRLEHPLGKLSTPEMFLPDGSKVQVEVLAEGQQFVCDGLHPDTGQPYRWTNGSPADVAITELPIVTEEMVREMLDEAERLLQEAGAIEKEKQTAKRPPRRTAGSAGGSDFFRNVNSAALADIEGWVRRLFPTARFQLATGAWRVSSEDLGRLFEEDLSIHPDGVRDFGEEVPRSPIDLVIEYHGAKDALAAAKWLCEQLGVDPTTLGWRAGNGLDERGLADLEARTRTGAATPSGTGPAGAAENPRPPQDNSHDPAAAAESDNPKVGGGGGWRPVELRDRMREIALTLEAEGKLGPRHPSSNADVWRYRDGTFVIHVGGERRGQWRPATTGGWLGARELVEAGLAGFSMPEPCQ